MNPHISYAALVGIDWASQSHAVALLDTEKGVIEESTLLANPNAIDHWARQLQQRFHGKPIALSVELCRGALIDQLAQFDFIHIYPLNPVTSARFRKAFKPSGAKDDPADARTHLSILQNHRDSLRLWVPSDPRDRRLQLLCDQRRKLVNLRVDFCNRLTAALRDYYPLALEVAGSDLASPLACAFLLKWPNLTSLKRSKSASIRKFYYRHGSRRGDVIEKRLKAIEEAKAVSEEASLLDPHTLYVKSLVEQIKALGKSIAKFEEEIDQAFAQHRDYELWNSFPGAGKVLGPRLAVAWTSDHERFETAHDMQIYSGIAPVRNASGKRATVFRRYHRPLFLHQTFWEYAKQSTHYCQWARTYVEAQVKRGRRRSTAYRSLAFKWQRIMQACLRNGTPYDDELYTRALEKSGSAYHSTDRSAA